MRLVYAILISILLAFSALAEAKTYECVFPELLTCKSEFESFCASIKSSKAQYKIETIKPGAPIKSSHLINGEWKTIEHGESDFFEQDGYQVFSMATPKKNQLILIVNKPDRAELDFKRKLPMIEYRLAGSCKGVQ